MSENKSTVWRRGGILDPETERARRPWAFLLGVVSAVVFVDLLLAVALASRERADHEPVDSARRVREIFAEACAEDAESWLLLGDSVVAGDVLQGRLKDWHRHRLLDYLRSQKNPASPQRFRQIGLNGMLPVDMLRLVRELDGYDSAGHVSLLIEVNPRYFSGAYFDYSTPTRSWLDNLGREIAPGAVGLMRQQYDIVSDWVIDRLPIFRHVGALNGLPRVSSFLALQSLAARDAALSPRTGGVEEPRIAGFARVIEHYQSLRLDEDSVQVRAIREIVARANQAGRRVVFFSTPLDDAFQAQAMSDQEYGDYIGRLSGWMDEDGSGNTELINMDAPVFRSIHFVDHCHLLPDGNRILALNILYAMGIGLGSVARSQELISRTGPDRTLVWDIHKGSSNGAGWQARFDEPGGVALDWDRRWIVIADTKNHCLRELRGNFQTVRTLAGRPGHPGKDDGPLDQALLDLPSSVLLHGEEVWFVDASGRRLRRLSDGLVLTETPVGEVAWTSIGRLQWHRDSLYLLDRDVRLLAYDPKSRKAAVVAEAPPGAKLSAFDFDPEGRLFIAEFGGRIWRCETTDQVVRLDGRDPSAEVWFAGAGEFVSPRGVEYPMPFDQVGMHGIQDIYWWAAYDGLLVYNEEPVRMRPEFSVTQEQLDTRLTERVFLRLLDGKERRVFPWLKTHAYSSYYWMNYYYSAEMSDLHRGVMALDEKSGHVLQLERDRSRLILYGDGIWAAAKEGNGRTEGYGDVWPGTACAQLMSSELRPERLLPERLELRPLKGPYVGLMLGSSLMSTSDTVQQYSCARAFEVELRDIFEQRDRLRFDLVLRTTYGLKARDIADLVATYINSGLRPDVIFIDLFSDEHQQNFDIYPLDFSGAPTDKLNDFLNRIESTIRPYGIKLVFMDNSGFFAQASNGLRPPEPCTGVVLDTLEAAGYSVLRPSQSLLRDSLEDAPVGAAPLFRGWHAAPWAANANARVMAEQSYDILSPIFASSIPGILRPEPASVAPPDPSRMIGGAFVGLENQLRVIPGFDIPPTALHRTLGDSDVQFFLDAGRIEGFKGAQRDINRLIFSVLRSTLGARQIEGRVARVEVKIVRFNNYDEYGQGVRQGATILAEHAFDRESLGEFLVKVIEDFNAESAGEASTSSEAEND